jgi:poly-gamma-glutamate capsule biosynthesis protein CapA/YwtB (metallophosphatase superfamily)
MPIRQTLIVFAAAIACATPPASAREIVITAVGDIMLAGSGTATYARLGYDYPFAATTAELKNGDIVIGNLEAPISRHGREDTGKKFRYRSMAPTAAALRNAGFSIVTLANNHTMDFGDQGLKETLEHLDLAGIGHAGAGATLDTARRASIVSVKGVKVAVLAYSFTYPASFYATADRPGTAPGAPGYYRRDIARAREQADYVVVAMHWGAENTTVPKPYQVAVAHRAIDAGADVVLGHHPHVLQGIECYKQGVIFYSLGNYAFGTLSKSADRSVIARITLDHGVREIELLPLNVRNSEVRYQPKPLGGERGQGVIDRLNRISREMGTAIVGNRGRFLVRMTTGAGGLAQREEDGDAQTVRGD